MNVRLTGSGVNVSGSAIDLRKVAQDVRSFIESKEATLGVRTEIDISTNASDQLCGIEFMKRGGAINVTVDSRQSLLVIEGSSDNLLVFCSHFEFDDDAKAGEHQHPEYIDKSDYIQASAIPVVIEVDC